MIDFTGIEPFSETVHQPFDWRGGKRALLLVHGFPGTPAEMRPLATLLQDRGWTTRGILLPGFGREIATLPERKADEWTDAVVDECDALRKDHEWVGLVGFSMGGAVAVNASVVLPPDRLILIAPFWRFGNRIQATLWPLISRLIPRIRPYRNVDFRSKKDLAAVEHFLGQIDQSDPELLESIRQFEIPTSLLNELRNIGRRAHRQATELTVPTLILQAESDTVCPPRLTRRLAERITSPVIYEELPGDHNLLRITSPVLGRIAERVDTFAAANQTISDAKDWVVTTDGS